MHIVVIIGCILLAGFRIGFAQETSGGTGHKNALAAADSTVRLSGGQLLGGIRLVPNLGAAFQPLRHKAYPGRNLFKDGQGGLNFEHIFNGTANDEKLSWFTPRRDKHLVVEQSETTALVHHPASESAWSIESEMHYSLTDESAVDMHFRVKLQKNRFALGYVAFMWASYMQGTLGRTIHFPGKQGNYTGWLTFGETTGDSFETGTISAIGVSPLPFEPNAATLNVIEHQSKQFSQPFYYGLMDGDGNSATTDDVMAYIMMFDQTEPIRFALWNFIRDKSGNPDPRQPAWDWQFVIRNPELGKWYEYHARMAYVPFESREAIVQYYENWRDKIQRQNK